MIKVEAVVSRDRVETVIGAVEEKTGHGGVTVTEASGRGSRRRAFEGALLTFIVPEHEANRIAETISEAARGANEAGDGLVWVSPAYHVRHIRTGKPLHEYVEPVGTGIS